MLWVPDSEVCREMDELQHAFRDVMAGVATPVAVVTTLVDDVPHGTTVSAFASLSMNPPMVLVALDRGSRLLAQIRQAQRYGVNILGATQSALALTFAGKGQTKFEGLQWQLDQQLPRLPGVPGWLACDLAKFVDGGDHVIALGTVRAAERAGGQPLTYHSRVFGTHNALGALDGLTP